MNKGIRTIGVVIMLFSLPSMCLGAYFYMKTNSFLANAIRTDGEVIKVEKIRSGGDTLYYPVFSFVDNRGNEHSIRSDLGSNPPRNQKGDMIGLYYLPDNPKEAEIDSFINLWLVPIVACGLSLGSLLIGLAIFIAGPIIANAFNKGG